MKHLDLFSGIGGFALACKWLGIETIGFVEIDKFCQKVLRKNFPNVPIMEDIKDVKEDTFPKPIDLITGGFPCQDISCSGKGVGLDGKRSGLWNEMRKVISNYRPRYVLVENVAALTFRGLGRVLADLTALRYDTEWAVIPASACGAPHRRERCWIIAYPNRERCENSPLGLNTLRLSKQKIKRAFWLPFISESPILRVDDGLPNRIHRSRSLGNAIVPQVAYEIIKMVMELNI